MTFPPVTVRGSVRLELRSRVNGSRYTLLVSWPQTPPPPEGFPVLYVLDGSAYHGMVTDLVRLRTSAMGAEMTAPLIVSIAHPEADGGDVNAWAQRRLRDFTPTASGAPLPLAGDALYQHISGGADAFFDVIEQEIAPLIAQHFPASSEGAAILGHSLGGLAVVHALFTRPGAFATFIASSPALWWDGLSVLRGEAGFGATVCAQRAVPKVFICVGELEQQVPPFAVKGPDGAEIDRAILESEVTRCRMVDNAAELAARLAQLAGAPGVDVRFQVLPGESHATAIVAALRPGLDLAFRG